jgi:hypothetical protein
MSPKSSWQKLGLALCLRPDRSIKSYAGNGTNKACDGCDRPITPENIEYEVDIANRTLRFHRACFTIWQAAEAKTSNLP